MSNFSLKLLSVICGILLFIFIRSQMNASVLTVFVPVEFSNLPEDKVIVLPREKQVRVSLKGPSFLVSEVAVSVPSFKVQLPAELNNRLSVSLNRDNMDLLPAGIEIVAIEPSEMEIFFDNLARKSVPVEVARLGSLSDDYKLVDLTVIPETVEISGPETEISKISAVETFPLDLRPLVASSEFVLSIRQPGSLTTLSKVNARVNATVLPVKIERVFENLTVETRSSTAVSLLIESPTVTIEISGPKALLGALEESKVVPYVRLGQDHKAGESVRIAVDIPDGLAVIDVKPEAVKLIAAKKKRN